MTKPRINAFNSKVAELHFYYFDKIVIKSYILLSEHTPTTKQQKNMINSYYNLTIDSTLRNTNANAPSSPTVKVFVGLLNALQIRSTYVYVLE